MSKGHEFTSFNRMTRHFRQEVLIDYAAGEASTHVTYETHRPLGGVTLSRSAFLPNPGVTLGSKQAIVAIHSPPAFELDWRDPERDRLQRTVISPGCANINRSELPVFHSWKVTANAVVVALEENLITQTIARAFDGHTHKFPIVVGVEDPVVQNIAALCDREIFEGSSGGRSYAEGLATALIIHLVRTYGQSSAKLAAYKGGLPPAQLRLVNEYMEAHLDCDLGLSELAALTGLSTHHFGQAFKASTGIPPHQYLINKRVSRAKELLKQEESSIAEIAVRVGFSSQSHLTFNFRKLTGATPAQYRTSHDVRQYSLSASTNSSQLRRRSLSATII